MKLDGVVTLVDAKHAELHLDEIKPDGVVNEAIEPLRRGKIIGSGLEAEIELLALESMEQRLAGLNLAELFITSAVSLRPKSDLEASTAHPTRTRSGRPRV